MTHPPTRSTTPEYYYRRTMVTLDLGIEDCERPEINYIPTRTRNNSEEMVDMERTVHRRYNRHD
jgi:hypothetical protein